MANPSERRTNPEAAREAEKAFLPRETLVAETPHGPMTLVQRGQYLTELRFGRDVRVGEATGETPLLLRAKTQLDEYFAGTRTHFDLPLAPLGTPFQTAVWEALAANVPYGQTVGYGELAARCNRPGAARAVGHANHNNPLPIFIPCHRVIGANGSLVGYGGGLALKESLLALEKAPHTGNARR